MHEKHDKLINTCTWCSVGYEAFTYFVKYKIWGRQSWRPYLGWPYKYRHDFRHDISWKQSNNSIQRNNKYIQDGCLNELRGESHSTYQHIVIRTCSSSKGIWKTHLLFCKCLDKIHYIICQFPATISIYTAMSTTKFISNIINKQNWTCWIAVLQIVTSNLSLGMAGYNKLSILQMSTACHHFVCTLKIMPVQGRRLSYKVSK